MTDSNAYTHAEWLVLPGREEEFIAAWKDLGQAFAALERPPLWGSLLRSNTEPRLFYSFGPWRSAEDVAAMRAHAPTQAALHRVRALCERATPGGYQRVAHVDLTSSADGERTT
jgi:hypothetical protein